MPQYFAYGSNMDEERMKSRRIAFTKRVPAILYGYKLTFNKMTDVKGFGYATIEKGKSKDFVEGILYTVNKLGIMTLDRFEGYPYHYNRIDIKVCSDGIECHAITYIATPEVLGKKLIPFPEYLDHLLAGKEFLSDEYFNFLESFVSPKII